LRKSPDVAGASNWWSRGESKRIKTRKISGFESARGNFSTPTVTPNARPCGRFLEPAFQRRNRTRLYHPMRAAILPGATCLKFARAVPAEWDRLEVVLARWFESLPWRAIWIIHKGTLDSLHVKPATALLSFRRESRIKYFGGSDVSSATSNSRHPRCILPYWSRCASPANAGCRFLGGIRSRHRDKHSNMGPPMAWFVVVLGAGPQPHVLFTPGFTHIDHCEIVAKLLQSEADEEFQKLFGHPSEIRYVCMSNNDLPREKK